MDNEVLTILRGLVKGCRGMGNSAYRAHGIDRDTKNDYILSLQECKVRGKERHLTTPQVSESNIGFIRYLGVQARNLRMKGALLMAKRNNSGAFLMEVNFGPCAREAICSCSSKGTAGPQ